MKKIFICFILFLIGVSFTAKAQQNPQTPQYPSAYITAPQKGSLYKDKATIKCSYNLPIHVYSELYALGVVWSTNPNDLNFVITKNSTNHYGTPTPYMKYGGGKKPNGRTFIIGDGSPAVVDNSKSTITKALIPNTTYYARAFVFAKVCTTYIPVYGGNIVKDVWYSNTISFTTPDFDPITNNQITSFGQNICSGGTVPTINSTIPKGGDNTYTYQWQSNTDLGNNIGWTNIGSANGQNYTPVFPTPLTQLTRVWYRRIVTSANLTDSMNTNPCLYVYTPPLQDFNMTISRMPYRSDSLAMKALIFPEISPITMQWKKCTTEDGAYITMQKNTMSSFVTDSSDRVYYKVFFNVGNGCPNDSSTFVRLSPSDGNKNRYLYTKVNNQYWMIENLRATNYTDNSALTNIKINASWAGLTSPAYCWYQNDSAKNAYLYGGMYNFYIDTTKICPTGWKVASTTEWGTLIDYAGGKNVAGGNLAITDQLLWNPKNTMARNQFNFNWIPAGYRSATGVYSGLNSVGRYWTKTVSTTDPTFFYNYGLDNNDDPVKGANVSQKMGLSIRCVKK